MDSREDGELMLAAGQGDREAFAVLAERHHRAIIQFVHRFLGTGNRDLVEDLAQEVFFEAWRYAPSFRPRAQVLTWLLRIATNDCLNHRRDHRARATVPLDTADVTEHPAPEASTPEAQALARERAEKVRTAIAGLPPNQRTAILLHHFHGLPYKEIADVLDSSLAAVESLLFRAKRTLGAELSTEKSEVSPQVSPQICA